LFCSWICADSEENSKAEINGIKKNIKLFIIHPPGIKHL